MATEPKDGRRARAGAPWSRRAFALLLMAAGGAASAGADLFVKQKIAGGDGKPLGERTWIFAPDRVRMDEGGFGFVLDAAHERGWIWGEEGGGCQAYSAPGTGATRVAPASTDPNAELFEKALEATIAALSEGPIQMRPQLTEERTIAGHEAQRYDFSVGDKPIQRRWIASSVPNPDLDAIIDRLQASPLFSVNSGSEEAMIVFLTRGLGYALRVEDLRNGQSVEVVELRTSALPATAFTPPAGCPGI